jgi:hypothetical protein
VTTEGRPVDRSRASGQETRRRILAAADDLFITRGYERVTIRDIAVAADADPALVIRYFGSKNDLFVLVRQPDLHLEPPQPSRRCSIPPAGTPITQDEALGGSRPLKINARARNRRR